MDLDASPFRCFVAVATEGGFSRAALRLNISQPALSATIKQLEMRLGFALFKRTSRRVELTSEGRLFLDPARRYINEAIIVNREARAIRTTELRISSALYMTLIPERVRLFHTFLDLNPGMNIEVHNSDYFGSLTKLNSREVDLVLVLDRRPKPEEPLSGSYLAEEQMDGTLERQPLLEKTVDLLVPTEHPLAEYETIPVEALTEHSIAIYSRHHGIPWSESISQRLTEIGARLIKTPEDNAIAVEQYARFRRLPAITLGWLKYQDKLPPDVVVRRVDGLGLKSALTMIRFKQHRPPAADDFWSTAVELAQKWGWDPPLPVENSADLPADAATLDDEA